MLHLSKIKSKYELLIEWCRYDIIPPVVEDGLCWLCCAEQGQSCCRVVVTFPVFHDQECDHLVHQDINYVPAFNKLLGLER